MRNAFLFLFLFCLSVDVCVCVWGGGCAGVGGVWGCVGMGVGMCRCV